MARLREFLSCPLGYDSKICDLPQTCSNYSYCQNTSAAWPLPYYWDNDLNCLVITFSNLARHRWCYQLLDGVLVGLISNLYDSDFSHTLIDVWDELGYAPAVSLPFSQLQKMYPEWSSTIDPIPF